ncbi:hypothetical protein UWK_02613 [Desulfocapsa sulfexigens DSM 10523]|uniref:Periplasmic component of the Tol biopolymer transport system n=2 Tax=Desulfocapsa TaxID=53318 RepID=M1NHS6_DESSD|nr:hypothetical protein UWK_02613 [Desulfocapsa sulfexigens DSM 10523]
MPFLKPGTLITAIIFLFMGIFFGPSYSHAATETALVDKLIGKIVYQRPDGIYMITVGEKSPQHLLNYGTNPRWSPNGKQIAFVHGNAILILTVKDGTVKQLATASKAKALCFFPDGKSVIFTDDKLLRRVDIKSRKIKTLLQGEQFYEVDIAKDGKRLTATVRGLTGFKVRIYDLQSNSNHTVSRGCSASISPDGSKVTVNGGKHRILHIHQWDSLKKIGQIHAPTGKQFDNQLWSNSPQWLVSTTEGKRRDLFLHHINSDSSFQITTSGDCDRGDLYVSRMLP